MADIASGNSLLLIPNETLILFERRNCKTIYKTLLNSRTYRHTISKRCFVFKNKIFANLITKRFVMIKAAQEITKNIYITR